MTQSEKDDLMAGRKFKDHPMFNTPAADGKTFNGDNVFELRAEIQRLEHWVAELREDRDRLNWLEQTRATVASLYGDFFITRPHDSEQFADVRLRAAIDAALEGE